MKHTVAEGHLRFNILKEGENLEDFVKKDNSTMDLYCRSYIELSDLGVAAFIGTMCEAFRQSLLNKLKEEGFDIDNTSSNT